MTRRFSYVLLAVVASVTLASCGSRERPETPASLPLMEEKPAATIEAQPDALASPMEFSPMEEAVLAPEDTLVTQEVNVNDSTTVMSLLDEIPDQDGTATVKHKVEDASMEDPLSALFADMPDTRPAEPDSAAGAMSDLFMDEQNIVAVKDSAVQAVEAANISVEAPQAKVSEESLAVEEKAEAPVVPMEASADTAETVLHAADTLQNISVMEEVTTIDTNDIFALMAAAAADTVVTEHSDSVEIGVFEDERYFEEDIAIGLESRDSGVVSNDDVFNDVFAHDTAVYVKLQVHRDISQRFDEGTAADTVAALPEDAVPSGSRHMPSDGSLKKILMLLLGLLAMVFVVAAVSLLLPMKKVQGMVKEKLSGVQIPGMKDKKKSGTEDASEAESIPEEPKDNEVNI